jgi:hypothetical protein
MEQRIRPCLHQGSNLTAEKYDEMEKRPEEMVLRVCTPAMKLAKKLFQ